MNEFISFILMVYVVCNWLAILVAIYTLSRREYSIARVVLCVFAFPGALIGVGIHYACEFTTMCSKSKFFEKRKF